MAESKNVRVKAAARVCSFNVFVMKEIKYIYSIYKEHPGFTAARLPQ